MEANDQSPHVAGEYWFLDVISKKINGALLFVNYNLFAPIFHMHGCSEVTLMHM